jgi:hypothetical protein
MTFPFCLRFLLVVFLLAGCSRHQSADTSGDVSGVQPTDGESAQQLVAFANKKIPRGTARSEVEKLLAPGWEWKHYQGRITGLLKEDGSFDTNDVGDVWALQYDLRGRTGALLFEAGDKANEADYTFSRACVIIKIH